MSQGKITSRLQSLGIVLPKAPTAAGAYSLAVTDRDRLYISGQLPWQEDGTPAKGKVGQDVSPEQAKHHARLCGLSLIAVASQALGGDLDRIVRVVKILVLVNAVTDFTEHPIVANGCSELMQEVFAERGDHARSAVGVGSLPKNASVEVEGILAIDSA